jgi:3-oxoacyl-[acyl-carrier protein] reductase
MSQIKGIDMKLSGRVALVTGAGRGIGRAIALRLAEEGAEVGVNDLSFSSAENTAKRIIEGGGQALALGADVTDREQVNDAIRKLADRFGRIDILVNNAGVRKDSAFTSLSPDLWNTVVNTFLQGCFNCSQVVQHYMTREGYGKIVNIASTVPPAMAGKGNVNYSTANAGLEGFTRALAVELGPCNINVNCIAADFIDTEMTRAAARQDGLYLEDLRKFAVAAIPLRRLGTPADVANLALFLVSDEANFITGQTVKIRGGP